MNRASQIMVIVVTIVLSNHSSLSAKECPKECIEDSPVCGSDGKIYMSRCEMEMKNCGMNLTATEWKNCGISKRLCPLICLQILDPVCGDDGKIYSNRCIMQKQNCGKEIRAVNMEKCENLQSRNARYIPSCPQVCIGPNKLVCGSDQRIYRNECVMKLKNCGKEIQAITMIECLKSNKCPRVCLSIQDPVCGSDGQIYLNECQLLRDNCGKGIRKVPMSRCSSKME
ncbi:uncharacterized protein LOC141850031 [Brevipalpus obovatus]|uniref:uncharacterized protein LOC141850031 n=1 Tax=Brevipalpus obovatus TaxID=246614 RepID=UPI003D9F431D